MNPNLILFNEENWNVGSEIGSNILFSFSLVYKIFESNNFISSLHFLFSSSFLRKLKKGCIFIFEKSNFGFFEWATIKLTIALSLNSFYLWIEKNKG